MFNSAAPWGLASDFGAPRLASVLTGLLVSVFTESLQAHTCALQRLYFLASDSHTFLEVGLPGDHASFSGVYACPAMAQPDISGDSQENS